ncbi:MULTISPECIES: zf-HC2 domain-containing protein [unclassified Microbacterium]|uniref:zf-HC2 domain-containing protein n=1 Tax=unclassified Microbacterium TaxID=2609290 RepID=UPI003649F111
MSADPFAMWDAAYVMGALSAADRARYEAHLAGCAECREAVADLVPAVGLLSRVHADDAARIGVEHADAAGPKLLSIARARRRSRRRALWTGVGIAAALAVAVPVTIAALAPRPAVEVALEGATTVPVSATVSLTPVAWGTKIDMACLYAADAPDAGWTYVLTVVGRDGTTTDLSTWKAEPGRTATLSAGTAAALKDIRSVEIRTAAGAVILRHDIGG